MRSTLSKVFGLFTVVFFFIALVTTNVLLSEAAKAANATMPKLYVYFFIIGYSTCAAALILNFTKAGRLTIPLMLTLFFLDFAIGQVADQTALLAILVTFYGLIFIGMLFVIVCSFFDIKNENGKKVLLMFTVLMIVFFCFFNFIAFITAAEAYNTFIKSLDQYYTIPAEVKDAKRALGSATFVTISLGLSYISAIVTKVSESKETY